MRLVIIGAGSGLGKAVADTIKKNNVRRCDVITYGRTQDCDVRYCLGDLLQLESDDRIVYFAWDRSAISKHNNINLTSLSTLIRSVPDTARIIFVSTESCADPISRYALTKRQCERLVTSVGGNVIRIGAVMDKPGDRISLLKNGLPFFGFSVLLKPARISRSCTITEIVEAIHHLASSQITSEILTLGSPANVLSGGKSLPTRKSFSLYCPRWVGIAIRKMNLLNSTVLDRISTLVGLPTSVD